jgi:transposase-like protein
MMAYSKDLRERVLFFVEKGGSKTEAARQFGVSRAIVFMWCRRPAQREAKKPGPKGCWKLDLLKLRGMVIARPDSYQQELAKALGVTRQAVCFGLRKLGVTRKKNDAVPGALLRK